MPRDWSVRRAPVAPARPSGGARAAMLLLAAIGLGVYWNSLSVPFVWDDRTAIVDNASIRSLAGAWTPPGETPLSGRPLVNVSLALNYAAGGLGVTGYHAVNIAIHLACALLLFGIVRRTFERMSRPATLAALAVALVWMVHPIQSEAVDYLTERTESLMGLFFFLTMYCAIRARSAGTHRRRWEVAAVAACMLAMASKETAVTLPLIVVLYDRAFEFGSLRDAWKARRAMYVGLASTWTLLAVLAGTARRSTIGFAVVGPWTYLLNQCELVTRYLWLTVWPRALVLDYGVPRALTFSDVAPAAILLAALAALAAFSYSRWPRAGFLAVAFFVTLGPSSSIVPVATEVGAERRMYVPLAALVTLGVVFALASIERLRARAPERARALMIGAAAALAVVVTALAARTVLRNAEYASPLTLWQTVLERRPHGRAHYSVALALFDAGRHDEAMAEFRKALIDFPDAHFPLGAELFAAGRLDEAAAELRAFIDARPTQRDRGPAHVLLGQVLLAQGRFDEAAREFQGVAASDPPNRQAQEGLAAVGAAHRDAAAALMSQNRAAEAIAHARKAVRLLPRDPASRNLLGVGLASTGQLAEAIAQFRDALELDPSNAQAHNNLTRAESLLGASRPP